MFVPQPGHLTLSVNTDIVQLVVLGLTGPGVQEQLHLLPHFQRGHSELRSDLLLVFFIERKVGQDGGPHGGGVGAQVLHHQDVPHLPGQEGQWGGASVTEVTVRQGTGEDLHRLGNFLVENLFWFFLLLNVLIFSHPTDAQKLTSVFLEEHGLLSRLTSTVGPIVK